MNGSKQHFSLSELAEVETVCRETETLLARQKLSGQAFAVELLLREFLNNAIIHGHSSDVRKRVEVSLQIGRKWILLRISDQGPGFAWRKKSRVPPDGTATGGRGLAIGAQYAERMQFNQAGNQVTLWIKKP